MNPAYHRWPTDWPPVAAALLAAAERTGAVLVTMSNLYGYGRPSGPMTPESPLAATDTKGVVRPGCGPTRSPRTRPAGSGSPRRGRPTSSARRCRRFLAPGRQLPALQERRAWVVGDPDVARSWGYLPDVAATLATLGTDERALGRAWRAQRPPGPSGRRSPTSRRPWASGAVPVTGIPWPVLAGRSGSPSR